MVTSLKIGEYIAYRRKGQTEYAQIVAGDAPDEKWMVLCGDRGVRVPKDSIVHHGVWKKDEFIPRKFTIMPLVVEKIHRNDDPSTWELCGDCGAKLPVNGGFCECISLALNQHKAMWESLVDTLTRNAQTGMPGLTITLKVGKK